MKKVFLFLLCLVVILSLTACGADGKDGAQGPQGEQGVQGIQGEKGEKGDQGEPGAQGEQGLKGDKGEPGEQGIQGVQGEPGAAGKDGKDGVTPTLDISADGYWIINGVKTEYQAIGKDGATGATGAAGKDGKDGVTPTIEISTDGYWIINGVKTEYKAIGKDGVSGEGGSVPTIEISADGYWMINGVKTEYKVAVDSLECDGLVHTYQTETVKPTCTEKGYTLHKCTKCSYEYRDNYTEKTEHKYGAWTVLSSTCTTKISCKVCADCAMPSVKTESGTWHNYSTTVVAPTCEEQGYTLHACSKCGDSYKDTYTATVAHDFDDVSVLVSNCVKYEVLVKCKNCSEIKVESREPVEPHTYVDNICVTCREGIAVWNGSVASSFAGGSGTEVDPYLITSGAQLAYLASSKDAELYDKYYKLMNSISLDNREWNPIGYYGAEDSVYTVFSGSLDGNGFVISDYKITTPLNDTDSEIGYGLFCHVSGEIKNLGISDCEIDVTAPQDATSAYAGGLAGICKGKIVHCYVNSNVTVSGTDCDVYAGGLVGEYSGGGIFNCYVDGEVTASSQGVVLAGGIAGKGTGGKFNNCVTTCDVTVTGADKEFNAGCFAGKGGTINGCYAYEGQTVVTIVEGQPWGAMVPFGTTCTLNQLNSEDFYTDELGWSTYIWDFSNLDLESGLVPVLK